MYQGRVSVGNGGPSPGFSGASDSTNRLMNTRPNPRNDQSYYSNIYSNEGPSNGKSSVITSASGGGGDKSVINSFRKKSLGPSKVNQQF